MIQLTLIIFLFCLLSLILLFLFSYDLYTRLWAFNLLVIDHQQILVVSNAQYFHLVLYQMESETGFQGVELVIFNKVLNDKTCRKFGY